ncbi:MAG: hypothetical protein JRI49_04600 [Deltaproteobacteria bacterium]|nr:hypothetical protein [Deltaproteobacteria bacterium]
MGNTATAKYLTTVVRPAAEFIGNYIFYNIDMLYSGFDSEEAIINDIYREVKERYPDLDQERAEKIIRHKWGKLNTKRLAVNPE